MSRKKLHSPKKISSMISVKPQAPANDIPKSDFAARKEWEKLHNVLAAIDQDCPGKYESV